MNKERYQTFCQVCSKVLEADTVSDLIKKVEEHEATASILIAQGKMTKDHKLIEE